MKMKRSISKLIQSASGNQSSCLGRGRLKNMCMGGLLTLLCTLAVPAFAEDYTYSTNSGSITITGYIGAGGAVTIPGTINGLPVIRIGDDAFHGNINLTSIVVPDSVASIGDTVFVYCSNLTSATIGNGVTNIGYSAFFLCSGLTRVTMGNAVASIGIASFASCDALEYITLPASITYIDDLAFSGDGGYWLKRIYFRGNAPSFGDAVFSGNDEGYAFYLPGTTGWGSTIPGSDLRTALWNPLIMTNHESFGVGTNGFGFSILEEEMNFRKQYHTVVKACTNLVANEWIPLKTNSPAFWTYFSDPQWTNYPVRFYGLDML